MDAVLYCTILYRYTVLYSVLCCTNILFVDLLGILKTRSVVRDAILSGHQAQHKAHHHTHHQAQHEAHHQARHQTHSTNATLCNALSFVQWFFIHRMPLAGSHTYHQDNVMLCDHER